METVWPWLASFPIKLIGKEFTLHLHSIESLREFGLPWHQRYVIGWVENIAGKLCKKILSLSLKEYDILRKRFGNKVEYVPVAVDVEEHEKYVGRKEELREHLDLPDDKFIATFVGGMTYGPNMEAARLIATKIGRKVYEKLKEKVLFLIVGPDPPKDVFNLSYVRATGYVNSISPYVGASDLCIAPIFKGGGVKLKILDYMALRKPIIASNKAVEGLEVEPWIHYIPAETPDEFVQAIIEAAKNVEYLDITVAKHGYEYVRKNHLPELVTDIFIKALDND